MDVDRLHQRYTAYFTLLIIFTVVSKLTFLEASIWLMATYGLLSVAFGFMYFRFMFDSHRYVNVRYFTLPGFQGALQIVVYIAWVIFLLASWFTNAFTSTYSFYVNRAVGVWLATSFLVAFWLFKRSRSF